MKKLILTVAMVAAVGCGDKKQNANTRTLGGQPYVVVDDVNLTEENSEIGGHGSFSFVSPRKEEGNSYAITFTIEDGGALALITNAEKNLKNGVYIQFSRVGTKLNASLSNGKQSADISDSFQGIDASKTLSFQIDVHNDENPLHVLAWNGGAAAYSEESALLNSEDAGVEIAPGTGRLWGFDLLNAKVLKAEVSEPKFEE